MQQQLKPQPTKQAPIANRQQQYLETISIGQFKVEKVLIDGRIEYRLASDTPAHLLTHNQRLFLTNEIRRLHSTTAHKVPISGPAYSSVCSALGTNPSAAAPAAPTSSAGFANSARPQPATMYTSILRGTKERIYEAIKGDFEHILKPDITSPFRSFEDAIDRLLPYHIVQYRDCDYECHDLAVFQEQSAQNAVYFHQRFEQLQDRLLDIRRRCSPRQVHENADSLGNEEESQYCLDPYRILCDKLLNEQETVRNADLRKIGSAKETMTFTPADVMLDSVQFDTSVIQPGILNANLFLNNNIEGSRPGSPDNGVDESSAEEDDEETDDDDDMEEEE